MVSHRCNHGKAKSWPCSSRNSSLRSSYCYMPVWERINFRWGTVMPKSLNGAMPYIVLFASTRCRPTVQSTHRTYKMGPTFWSIHLRTRIIVSSPQILSVRPGTKEIFKSSFVFKYFLLRSQICIPRALKKWSSSTSLQRTASVFLIVSRGPLIPYDHLAMLPHSAIKTMAVLKASCRRIFRCPEEAHRCGETASHLYPDLDGGVFTTGDWTDDVEFAICSYFEAGSRLSTHEKAVADYWASLLLGHCT
jgi:hypothetical protein